MGHAKRSSADTVIKIDPQLKRPPNAAESVPEALVPDVVHSNLRQGDGDGADQPYTAAPDRWQRIQHRAYEIARARGFSPGAELNDWLRAEREIDAESVASTRQTSPEDQFTG